MGKWWLFLKEGTEIVGSKYHDNSSQDHNQRLRFCQFKTTCTV